MIFIVFRKNFKNKKPNQEKKKKLRMNHKSSSTIINTNL